MDDVILEKEIGDSDIYLSLGLSKGRVGKPRVLSIISWFLERHIQKNELLIQSKQIKDVITLFHGSRAPDLSIQQYIDRIFRYSACSPSCFVVAHIYIDRFLQRFDVNLTSFSVHRLLITSVMVAAKVIDDAFFNNAYYARVGGISTKELNRLEMKLLFDLDFRLQVRVETFRRYCLILEKEVTSGLPIERPIKMCGMMGNLSSIEDSSCAPTIAR